MSEIKLDSNPTMIPKPEVKQASEGVSPFLRYQDPNGDKLPDVCDIDVVPAENICKDCVPNPLAIVRSWRKTNQNNPFLNEKICKYQITFVTSEKDTGFKPDMNEGEAKEALEKTYKKYEEEAIVALLRAFQKDTAQGTVLKLKDVVEYTNYDLGVNQNSRLKLQYSIDFNYIFPLPDETPDQDEDDEELEDIKVSFETTQMAATNIKVRKGLNLYGRFLKVARAVEGKNIRFKESNKIFNFEDYGDTALFTQKSPVGDILRELDSWLNGRGYNIPNVAGGFFTGLGDAKVIKLDFVFTPEYKLKKLKVYTEGCGTSRPDIVYGSNKLESLMATDGWKDPTAVAYFAKSKAIEQDVSARQPMPFEEFIVKHTYPEVFVDSANKKPDGTPNRTIDSCIRDALANDFKELGQDILDEVFSLADAIAYKFHKNLCQRDPSEVSEEALLQGTNFGNFGITGDAQSNIYGLAKMQAYDSITAQDSAFANMCFRMISMGMSGVECGLSPLQQMDQMYAQGLDRMKVCGLLDLFLEALQCLFKGLTLEEAMASIIKAALNAMGVSQVGELFVGLPPEKQLELERLVNQKLESGDIFPPGSPGQATSDTIAGNQKPADIAVLKKFKNKKPWDDKKFVEAQEKNQRADNYGNMVPSQSPNYSPDDTRERRTLGQKLQAPLGDDHQTNSIILNAYLAAFMEVYQDNFLALLEELNKFPGAQLITSIIAMLDCPRPPLFNPGFDDFFKSLQLPFCRNTKPITFPRWENPFLYIPKLSDILKAIFEALKRLVECIIMRVIILIMAKVCEIIGDAICKAIEVAGQIGVGLLTGNANVGAIMRETICGPDASDETINNTILDLMDNFGVGGAAFADPERTVSLFGDFINSLTKQEALTMFVDGPTQTQRDIFRGLLQNDYPEFESSIPNDAAFDRMIANIGNVIPVATMQDIKDTYNSVVNDDTSGLPINPTLCATPEALESFEELRCDLLAGRMSTQQCKAQTQAARDEILQNANDIQKMINDGIAQTLENETPPLFSDPACDNGLLPFEPEASIKTATGALKGSLESLQIAYTDDMLGNGGLFASDDDWGFFNMVLSDTYANPYTAHQRKVYNTNRFVDFYIPNDIPEGEDNTLSVAPEKRQRGAYPYYLSDWLKFQFTAENGVLDLTQSPNFNATNDIQKDKVIRKSFDDLGFKGFFGDVDVNITEIQDFGYNTKLDVNYEKDIVKITKLARKKSADIILQFRDNAKGRRAIGKSSFAYGFDLSASYSDIREFDEKTSTGDRYYNIPNDNIRITLTETLNSAASFSSAVDEKLDSEKELKDAEEESIMRYTKYEFFAIDNTLDDVEVNETTFPRLFSTFYDRSSAHTPPVCALSDLTGLGLTTCKSLYNEINNELYNTIRETVGSNESVWLYGAEFDDLTTKDFEYGINDNGVWVPYEEYQVPDYNDEGERVSPDRPVENDDTILGISWDQYNNEVSGTLEKTRIFYLNPTQYGQNYMSPALYIKPLKNKGWLGAVNLMFPEYSPCKPRSTNLIGFDDIQSRIDQTYPRIPEDKRLKTDPDCVSEVPFNRILARPSRAGIESIITALIRIFASTHFIKSLPVFATFAPKFPENYSNIYAAYIIENMAEACLEAGNNFLSPFKDNEFWYAFLEQAVQLYSRRLDDDMDETITPENVPVAVADAIEKINNLQENYKYPYREDLRDAPKEEKSNFQSLKSYREEKNLEAVRSVEEEAKIILQELVKEQLAHISEIFKDNLARVGFSPSVANVDCYFLRNFASGASSLNFEDAISFLEEADEASTELKETIETGSGYTIGDTFTLPDGTPYVGDYHAHMDDDGSVVFMVGAEHVSADHDVLIPYAHNVILKGKNAEGETKEIGDVEFNPGSDKKFYIRKYVTIDDTEYSVSGAQDLIRALGPANLSGFYPGTMKTTTNDAGRVVGIEGNLGVQNVIEFGMNHNGSRIKLARVAIDALDLPAKEFVGPEKNSKLLLCLIDNLRDEPNFRMVVDYIFSMKKALSTYAIYTDMAFMPSIGEYTIERGNMFGGNLDDKPGVRVEVSGDQVSVDYTLGWAPESDRNGLFASPFFRKWDEWDQVLLRKSVKRAKKIFRPYYRKRKFEVEDDNEMGPGSQYLNTVKQRFKPLPGGTAIPWFKKRKVKPNPFNNKGQICKKAD